MKTSNCTAFPPTEMPRVAPSVQTGPSLRNGGFHSDPNGKDKACSLQPLCHGLQSLANLEADE